MANHKTGAQRYNDRMQNMFDESKILKKKYGTEDKGYDNRSEAMKKSMSKKMKSGIPKKTFQYFRKINKGKEYHEPKNYND